MVFLRLDYTSAEYAHRVAQWRSTGASVPGVGAVKSRLLAALVAVSVVCTVVAGYFVIDVTFETAVAANSSLPLANVFSGLSVWRQSHLAPSKDSEHPGDLRPSGGDDFAKSGTRPANLGDKNYPLALYIAQARGLALHGEQIARAPGTKNAFVAVYQGLASLEVRYAAYQSLVRQASEITTDRRVNRDLVSRLHASSDELDAQFETLRLSMVALLTDTTLRLRQQQKIAVPVSIVSILVVLLAGILAFSVILGSPRRSSVPAGALWTPKTVELGPAGSHRAAPGSDAILPAVASTLLDGFFLFDADGVIEFASAATEAIFNLRADNQVGREIHDLIPALGRRHTALLASRETGPHVGRIADRNGHMIGKRVDGSDIPVQVSIGGVVIDGVQKFVCCVRDLTRQTESQRAAEALQEQVVQLQKRSLLGALATGVAHDLKNVLMPVISLTELTVAKLPHGSKEATNLAKVLAAANHARDLVRQILVFEGRDQTKKQMLRLDKVVLDAVAFLRATLPTSALLEENIPANAHLILADPTQIHQVVVNLGINASDAMAETGGVLRIDLSQIEIADESLAAQGNLVPGQYLCISVSDTGRGIGPESIDRIFEPFFTTKTVSQGAGLGLSVVANVVENHAGAITVHSQPGRGTTFRVYFPVKQVG